MSVWPKALSGKGLRGSVGPPGAGGMAFASRGVGPVRVTPLRTYTARCNVADQRMGSKGGEQWRSSFHQRTGVSK